MNRIGFLALMLIALPSACSDAGRLEVPWREDAPGVDARRLLASRWDTLWTVGGRLEDTLLQLPGRPTSSDSLVAVLDFASHLVLAFDLDGNFRWSFGGDGAGPHDLSGPRDLSFGKLGELFVLDPMGGRIVEVGLDGTLVGHVPLTEVGHHAEQFVALGSGSHVVPTTARNSSLVLLAGDGEVLDRREWPWSGFDRLHPLVREGATAADGDSWILALSRGNGWFAFHDTVPLAVGFSYVEHVPLPTVSVVRIGSSRSTRLRPSRICTGCDVSLDGGLLYVLFGGSGPGALQTIDVFHWDTGTYEGSYRLPYRASSLTVSGDRFFIVSTNPYPMLQALRPRTTPAMQ